MGAAQSTRIDVQNIIDNVISAKVRSTMKEQQRSEVMQKIDISGGYGLFSWISQDAELNVTSESVQSALANFKFTQEMVNKVQSEVTQKAQALTLSINKQDIEQVIRNRLSNRTEIENSVKQECMSSNLIAQSIDASKRIDFVLRIRQGVVGDIVRKCNNKNETIAAVVQGIENDLDIKSAQTILGLPFWLIAVIIVGVVLGLVFFGRGVSGVIRQNPTLGMGIVVLLAFTVYGVPVALRLTGTIGKGKVSKEEVIGMLAGMIFLLLLVKFVGDAQLGKRARNPPWGFGVPSRLRP
jgi:hypothetical protein